MPLSIAEKNQMLADSFHDVGRELNLKAQIDATQGLSPFHHIPADEKEAIQIAVHALDECARQTLNVLPEEPAKVSGVFATLFSRSSSDGLSKNQEQENVQKHDDNKFRPGQD